MSQGPAQSERRGVRVSLRWKMLAAFAGVFTIVYIFIAVWVYQYRFPFTWR